MSRTYRRTEKGNKKTWIKPFNQYLEEKGITYNYYDKETVRAWREELNNYDWFCYNRKGPGQWINTYVNRPQRRRDKIECRKIVNGYYDYDEGYFLNNKDPRPWWD